MANIFGTQSKLNQIKKISFLILATFASIISLSPSLKVIPSALVSTSFHDNQRLVELLLLSLILISNIFRKSTSVLASDRPSKLVIYGLITLSVISCTLAASPRHAFIEICIFAGLFYLAILLSELYTENTNLLLKCIVYLFWASILLAMLSFYTGYITATVFNTPVKWPNPLRGFSSIRSFNQYQLWTLGLITLPLLIFDFKKRFTPILINIVLVAWAVLLFFSASRGALLAWAIGLSITAITYRKIAWPFIRLQLIHISLGFLSYKILFELIPYLRGSAVVTGEVLRDTTYDRLELWALALNLIKDNPIFGVGPMHFAWYSQISAHPHNSVLQLMSEWGLPAAFIILSMASYGLLCWFKKVNIKTLKTKNKSEQNLAITLFFTFIISALYSLVDGVIVMPISQVIMFTIIGLMIGYASDKPAIIKSGSLLKSIFAIIVLITLIWSTMPEILQGASNTEQHFSIGYTADGPRLWSEVRQ